MTEEQAGMMIALLTNIDSNLNKLAGAVNEDRELDVYVRGSDGDLQVHVNGGSLD